MKCLMLMIWFLWRKCICSHCSVHDNPTHRYLLSICRK